MKIILLLIIFILLFYSNAEYFNNICLTAKTNLVNETKTNQKQIIDELGLINESDTIINNLFNLYNKSDISLKDDKTKQLITNILNDSNQLTPMDDYIIDENTSIKIIQNTLYVNNFKNSLLCLTINEKEIDNIFQEMLDAILKTNKNISQILSNKFKKWSSLSNETQNLILLHFNNIFKVHGFEKIDNLTKDDKSFLLTEINKKLPTKENRLYSYLNITDILYNDIIVIIDKSDTIKGLQRIIDNIQLNISLINLNINETIDFYKLLVRGMLFAIIIIKRFGVNNINIVLKLFGLVNLNQSFYEILKETDLDEKNYIIIIKLIMNLIVDNNIGTISNYNLNSIPQNVIDYGTTKIFKNCNKKLLDKLRSDRLIDLIQYNNLLQKCSLNK